MAQAFAADVISPCPLPEDNNGQQFSEHRGGCTDPSMAPNQDIYSRRSSETPGSSISGDSSALEFMEESGAQKPKVPLTVNEPARVEAELDKVMDADQKPSKAITVLKWVTMVFMFLAFLACLTISKISLLRIGGDLMETRNNKSYLTLPGPGPGGKTVTKPRVVGKGSSRAETDVLMLILIILIPYGITLIRSLFCGGFRSDKPWPCWKAIGWVS